MSVTEPSLATAQTGAAQMGAAQTGAADAHDSSATISVRGLWKVFGPTPEQVITGPGRELSRPELLEQTGCVAAVRDVSFDVAVGEVFVVMGLSGSGKSTLVRCLTRLIPSTSGSVLLDGEDVLAVSRARLRKLRMTKFSMVFQHFGLFAHRRVIDNIAYPLEISGVNRVDRYQRANEVIELVGLTGYADAYPEQLSGGMQQRVGLARALTVNPEVMFLDEPFSALDPLIRRDMQAEIIRLHHDLNKTMVFITHDLSEAMKLGDRIAIMRDGAIIQIGTPQELIMHPADDYVADFTRDIPKSHVLSVGSIAKPITDSVQMSSESIDYEVIVRDSVRRVVQANGAVRVTRRGESVGYINSDSILALVAVDAHDSKGTEV